MFTNVANATWVSIASSCKIWIDNENSKTNNNPVKWSGSCKNGFAEGKGLVQYNFSAEDETESCQGTAIKGRIEGAVNCTINNGNTFSGTIKNDQIIGNGVYTWKSKNCPTCFYQYRGTFYNNKFALGTLTLVNGETEKLRFYPDTKGCLIWNSDHKTNEVTTWSGKCKEGYASGKGVLQNSWKGIVETFEVSILNGQMNGYGVVNIKRPKCSDCIVKFKGTFKNHKPLKGVATLGNGKTKQINTENEVHRQAVNEHIMNEHLRQEMRYLHNSMLYGTAFP